MFSFFKLLLNSFTKVEIFLYFLHNKNTKKEKKRTQKEIKNTDINPYITYAVEFFIFIAKQSATNSPINQ